MNENDELLTLSELLARSWQEAKARFAPLFLLACMTPLLAWLALGLAFGFSPLAQNAAQQNHPFLFLAVSFLCGLCGLVFLAALVLFICKRVETVGQALKAGLVLLPRFLGATVLFIVAMTALVLLILLVPMGLLYLFNAQAALYGIVLLVFAPLILIGAAVAGVYLSLWMYPLILTDQPMLEAFRTSYYLVKGRFWNTLGILVVLGLINTAFAVAAMLGLGLISVLASLTAPGLAGLFSFLWVPVKALMALVFQLPLIALYLNRLSVTGRPSLAEDNPSLEEPQP